MKGGRIICWFSCGAASACATKLVLDSNDVRKSGREIIIARNWIAEEHLDNDRFQADCERWFGQAVIHITNEKYAGSVFAVQDAVKFIRHRHGAPCTRLLKKDMRKAFQQAGDIHVFGLHKGEESRIEDFLDDEPEIDVWLPLVERGMTKQDCHEMVAAQGIEQPAMYRLGYNNNNCIGCVKGQKGYWNKIRLDFPEAFERMAAQERKLGHSICKDEYRTPDGRRHSIPVFLDELPPDAGNYKSEPSIKCGVICEQPKQPAQGDKNG